MTAQKRVLVTGCAGFIGSNLCRMLLDEGYEVRGIDDLSAGLRTSVPEGVEFAELDIRDQAIRPLFEGVDVVFHLAARNCLSDCMEHPVPTASINVEGTVHVLEACRLASVAKIVYADSSASYEGIPDLPSREDRVDPIGPYAVSKRAGGQFVASYGRLHGLRYTILRYFNVYGPQQDYRRALPPVMAAFALALMQGRQPVIYGTGEKRRDFIYVDDVNRFHLLCLRDHRTDGMTLNVGTGENYSVLDVYEEIAEQLGSSVRPVFRTDLAGEAQETLADTTAARALGFVPEVGLKEGLARSIQHLRSIAMSQEPQP